MNFFSIVWMKIVNLFKEANLKPLDPVPVPVAEPVVLELLPDIERLTEDIERVKIAVPKMEVIQLDAVVASTDQPKEKVEPTRRRQLTKNFHIDEFACHDGTPVPEELYLNVLELAENLQVLRDAIGKPIKIMSGYRHLEYNKKIGGARKSQHMEALAADIKAKGIGPSKMADLIEDFISKDKLKKGGVGRYPTFTHYDVRGKNARWNGTRKKN